MPTGEDILAAGAAAAEKFVADSAAMDQAYREGKFKEWFAAYVKENISHGDSGGTNPEAERRSEDSS